MFFSDYSSTFRSFLDIFWGITTLVRICVLNFLCSKLPFTMCFFIESVKVFQEYAEHISCRLLLTDCCIEINNKSSSVSADYVIQFKKLSKICSWIRKNTIFLSLLRF